MAEATFGERVRAMRIERNLSQEGLASLLPKGRHLTWVSRVERGTQNVVLSDLYDLAAVLQVGPSWLVEGDALDTEFASRLKGMEGNLDERGKRAVLATAEREVEESRKRDAERLAEDEAEMVRLFRAASPEERDLLLAAAGRESGQPLPVHTPRPAEETRQARTA